MQTQNQPYHDRKLDMDIMMALIKREDTLPFNPDVPPLKSVAIVGGLLKNTFGAPYKSGDFYEGDMKATLDILAHFNKAGISLAPGAEFHIYNLLPPVKSDVLLAEDEEYAKNLPQCDLMILAYLIRNGATPTMPDYSTDIGFTNFEGTLYEPWPSQRHKNLISTSPLSREHDIWPRVAKNLGAQFVAATGTDHDEVTAKDFGGSEYQGIILTKDNYRVGTSYGKELSIVAKGFSNIAGLTNEDSIIGKGLRNPCEIEAPIDHERESQERWQRKKTQLDDINKALACGDINGATALAEQMRNEP